MEKDYKDWTPLKKALHNQKEPRLSFDEREIWFCHIGENIGFEQDGRGESFLRPVVIIKKFNNEIFWGVPLTRVHKFLPFYFSFVPKLISGDFPEKSTAILSQIRLIDAKRLRRRIGYMSEHDLSMLKQKLKALLP
jgi:mRNA interferase MazF